LVQQRIISYWKCIAKLIVVLVNKNSSVLPTLMSNTLMEKKYIYIVCVTNDIDTVMWCDEQSHKLLSYFLKICITRWVYVKISAWTEEISL